MKKPFLWVIILSLFILYSCGASKPIISQNRLLTTGIEPQEAIVILLSEHRADKRISDPQNKEPEIEECLKKSIEEETPKIKIIPAKQFREVMSLDNEISTDEILYTLNNEEMQKRLRYLGISCIVNVAVNTVNTYATKFHGEHVIGWTRNSDLSADIIDTMKLSKSGDVTAYSKGDAGVACIYVLPVPFFSRTESKACHSLGKAVHKFLVSKDKPPPKAVIPAEK